MKDNYWRDAKSSCSTAEVHGQIQRVTASTSSKSGVSSESGTSLNSGTSAARANQGTTRGGQISTKSTQGHATKVTREFDS